MLCRSNENGWVKHIFHVDGVAGSMPVQTTPSLKGGFFLVIAFLCGMAAHENGQKEYPMPTRNTLRTKVRNHPLIDLLFSLKGNPRTQVFIEPLWGIPHSLIAPFSAVYMRALGVSDIQIGLALSIAMITQMICAFFGGIITDKLGRKKTTILGDVVGWIIPCIIWACAQNYWFFLAAMVLNSFEQINQTAWVCLLVEDAEEKDILKMWNWISIAGLLAVFFSPLSGLLMYRNDLVSVMRVLYAIFGFNMLIKVLITYRWTTETRQGIVRRLETKGQSLATMIVGYWKLIPQVVKHSGTMRVLAIMIITQITALISGNFFSLYTTGHLGIPEAYLSYFPIIRAFVMLLFFFVIQHKLDRFRTKAPMCVGLGFYMLCQLLIIFSPRNAIWPLLLYTLFEAIAFGLVFPRKELMTAVFVDKQERARIIAMLTTLMMVISSPFGGIAGALSKLDGRFPFMLNLGLFVLAFAVIVTMKQNPGTVVEEA